MGIPINAYDTDPMTSSENEAGEKKEKRGLVSKAKGMFKWKYKSKNGIPKEQDLEAGKAIPSPEESDNKDDQQKKKKKGWWRRFKKGVSGAAVKVGMKKKKDDDGDRGAAICCAHLSFKARMWAFSLCYLLGPVSFFLSLFFIWDKDFDPKQLLLLQQKAADASEEYAKKDPRFLYAIFYTIGCILSIGSVFFLAGVCRQIRVSLRHCRLFSILIVVAAIWINIAVAFPRQQKGKVRRRSRRRLVGLCGWCPTKSSDGPSSPPSGKTQSDNSPPQGSTPKPETATIPGVPVIPKTENQPAPEAGEPASTATSTDSPQTIQQDEKTDTDADSPTEKQQPPAGQEKSKEEKSKKEKWWIWDFLPAWYFLLLIQICQVLFWFWYCLTYIPCACMRGCIQHCCSKSKKSKKDNEDKGKEE